ncbi:anti-H(O) lectin [Oryza sativa Japonica Group]|uniref:Os09g0336000 protein n=4 Tax=Oryza TaxID=4527 RepID=A0A0P0XM77_ORYSJ|nr:anti-H(O) lectin [Oryza sativa Japonica Group]EAZ08673.1 hypothetical protein OsI_30941 [Oryza sativa Indica Group]EAZ44321.1 hypothetical protein OsJ_28942 [Oryza sativa Japonica Group]KAF2915713.1 hypothetical protein DAI22_09g060000 [Oryza sativa Japonica Group]BAD28745.1 hypothetical protein [Oryza sativa Japonica Group]BAT07551.1 Os09g0336000 [Oryza sativa Japonica Group]
MSPRQLLSVLLISLLSTHPPTGVSSLSFSYDFSSQPHYNTKDLSLFYLKTTTSILDLHGRLHGDSTTTVWSKGIRSVGRVLHTQPVLLWDNATGAAASFTMTFCLRTQQQTGAGAGGSPPRMSVFLVPYYPSSNRNSRSVTTDGDDQIEEVEFETTLIARSSSMSHPSSSTSCRSSTPPWSLAGDTNHGSAGGGEGTVFVHIGYDHRTQVLTKSVRIGGAPCRSINSTVDLRRSLPSEVAVGFSSTTGHPIQLHNILLWSFNSTLETKTRSSPLTQPDEETLVHQAPVTSNERRSFVSWKQLLVRLDPWNRSVELGLGFQFFERSWVRLKLVLNSNFNISLEYGIGNEWD